MKAIRNSQGMTLIEIMIVLAIIAGLAAVLGGNIMEQFGKSKRSTVEVQFGEVTKALQRYSLDCGNLPQDINALVEAPSSCKNWGPSPYIKKSLLEDPWGNDIIYERNGSADFSLLSLGADGQEGGEGLDADISSDEI